jgi:hypothetical protein
MRIQKLAAAALLLTSGLAQAAISPAGSRAARRGPHAAGRREGGQRRRHDPGVGRRTVVAGQGRVPELQGARASPNPFPNDKPLFRITAANMNQYAAKLTEGHKALLRQYKDTYSIPVYQSRRTAASPQRIYDATKRIATTANLAPGGNGVTGAAEGIPFPIPKQGVEVFWNHVLRYRADTASRQIGQAAVLPNGSYNMVKFNDEFHVVYSLPGAQEQQLDNVILYFIQETVAPARLAGEILLVHETLDQAKENRRAWIYNPGQRRVRRAPNVAFDNPGTASDGLRTSDQFDIYNGSPERYDWKLVGKREMYVPYNAYTMHTAKTQPGSVIKPLHMNQDQTRYELHRVWVVDSVLKPGQRHIYKRRTLYVDEDSWQILAVDCYDNRDQLWRVQEGHVINYFNVPTLWTTMETTYDLQSRRYLALGFEDDPNRSYDFGIKRTLQDYTAAALRARGTR